MGNTQTVQGIYESFGRGDVPAILDRLVDDVAWDVWGEPTSGQAAGVPWLVERRGRAAVGDFFASLAGLEFHSFEPRALIADGDHVIALIAVDVTVRDSGERFRDEEIHHWTFGSDGRVAAFRHYVDTGKHVHAMAAVKS